MKNLTLVVCATLVCVFAFSNNAQARPDYNKALQAKYGADNQKVKEAGCLVCHPDKDNKKEKNDFGKCFGTNLGGSKIKDQDKIKGAIDKAAETKRADGKTYGEVIKAGELPSSK